MQGSNVAAAASSQRIAFVLTRLSPASTLLIAVANISTPGTIRSNGVENLSPTPIAVEPKSTT